MAVKRAAAPAPAGANFGSLGFYQMGGGLPEGDYVMADLTVQMYQAENKQGVKRGPARLGVMITFQEMANPGEEMRTQFYSMGTNSHLSWAPNPETGKGIVPIPGGPGAGLFTASNWAIFLKSLYDCGLPEGVFTNDVSVLEGTHVHITNIPEPEERKGFRQQAATGEAATEELNQGPRTIAVVSEIKDDGKPWEGTGGILETAPGPGPVAPKPAARAAGKPVAARPVARAVAPAPATVEQPTGDEGIQDAAMDGISAVLGASPNGINRLQARTKTFLALKASHGDEMAQAVMDTYFSNDAAVESLVSLMGYTLKGQQIVPIS